MIFESSKSVSHSEPALQDWCKDPTPLRRRWDLDQTIGCLTF